MTQNPARLLTATKTLKHQQSNKCIKNQRTKISDELKSANYSQCGIMQLVGFCGTFTFQKLRLPSDRLLTNCLPS